MNEMSNSNTLILLMVFALLASSLWAAAYLTMAVSYTVLAIFGAVYGGTITLWPLGYRMDTGDVIARQQRSGLASPPSYFAHLIAHSASRCRTAFSS